MTPRRLYTASEIATYLTCPRRWFWRYHEGLVPRLPPKAPAFGTLIHAYLAQHYGLPLVPLLEQPWDPHERETVLAQARAILAAYAEHDPVLRHGHTVTAVEKTFVVPFPTPNGRARTAALAGKIDLISSDAYGNVWLWDHKTCSTFASPDWLRLDLQMRLYLYAAQEMGLKPVGIVYNMVRKPQLQRHKAESVDAFEERLRQDIRARPTFYFRTELITTSPDLMEEVRAELIAYRKLIGKGPYVRNAEACRHMGCVYMELCLRDSPLARAQYRREEPHSELDLSGPEGGENAAS